jgi:hypothetical protein
VERKGNEIINKAKEDMANKLIYNMHLYWYQSNKTNLNLISLVGLFMFEYITIGTQFYVIVYDS